MGLVRTSNGVPPLSTADAKAHQRIDTNDEDSLVADYVDAAREAVEDGMGRAFVNQTWKYELERFPVDGGPIWLPRPPLSSITSVKYYDTDGTQQTWDEDNYTLDTSSEPGRVYPAFGVVWPATRDIPNAVEILFFAGFGTAASNVPAKYVQVVRFLFGHYYENREGVSDVRMMDVPHSIQSLIELHAVPDFGPLVEQGQ